MKNASVRRTSAINVRESGEKRARVQDFCEILINASGPPRNSRGTTQPYLNEARRRWRNASHELLFQTRIRSAKVRQSGKLTVKLLDISPAGDAGRSRTVRWNLLYAFVRHLGASEGELGP